MTKEQIWAEIKKKNRDFTSKSRFVYCSNIPCEECPIRSYLLKSSDVHSCQDAYRELIKQEKINEILK